MQLYMFSDLLTECSLDLGIMLKALATAYREKTASAKEYEEAWWECNKASKTQDEGCVAVAQTKLALAAHASKRANKHYIYLVQQFYDRGGTTAMIISFERLMQAEQPNLDFVKSTIH